MVDLAAVQENPAELQPGSKLQGSEPGPSHVCG